MPPFKLDTSTIPETIGYLLVGVCCLTFGSFAVPMKSQRAQSCNYHPLVFQTYKTSTMFCTAWLTLLVTEFSYTPIGIASGAFWVPAGIGAIYSVNHCGLAVGQGIWSSIIVIVSFSWGIFVFEEVCEVRYANLNKLN